MRTLFIIPLVLMSLVSFPSWGLTKDDLRWREKNIWFTKTSDGTGVPYTGEVEGEWNGSFKNGKKEGYWEYYNHSKLLQAKGHWKDGEKEGYWEYYDQLGRVTAKGGYRNGKKSGVWLGYNQNDWHTGVWKNNLKTDPPSSTVDDLVQRAGVYYKRFTDTPFTGEVKGQWNGFLKDGKREGSWTIYYKSGQLKYKGGFKNGKKEDPWEFYNEDGSVDKQNTGIYKNGVKISDS